VIPVSQTAAQILFWSAAAVAVFAQTMVLRAALAGRTPAASPATSARMRELLWIVLPAIALVVLLWFTWKAVPRSASLELSPTAMRSVARAHERFAGGV
jgi:heme/copper-type cytochrome/quinol oxidase subunit 2